MRIAFLGTPAPAVPALEALIRAGHDVALVVSQPDRAVGRSGTPRPSPVKCAASQHEIPVLAPTRVKTVEFAAALRDVAADVLVVVAYGRILPAAVLAAAPHGSINVHFSLLPELRGAAPVQWALARGLVATGVTTMQMNEALDEGDVLLQRELGIRSREHAPELGLRLAALGAELLLETLVGLERGTLDRQPQDGSRATYAPLLIKRDGEVDPGTLSAIAIANRVRGFDPWPGVWLSSTGRRLRLLDVEALAPTPAVAQPGALVASGSGLALACRGGTLLGLLRVQPAGGRAMGIAEALRGRVVAAGGRLEPASEASA